MAGINRSRINLGKRTQQQTATAESKGGAQRKGFMNYGGVSLKFYKFSDAGKIQDINILPWKIGSKNHPEVASGNMAVGEYDYVLDVWVHQKIGPNEEDFVCPKKTYGRKCPCCDEADTLWNEGTEESKKAARPLFARRKCVYQVQDLDEEFHAKSEEPMIFEVAHQNFSKDLQNKAAACMRGKGVVNFANIDDEGRVVSFQVEEAKMDGGRTYKKASNFEFNKRVEEVSDEILGKCVSLDSLMVVKTPDEIKDIMFGNSNDAASQDEEEFHQEPDEPEEESRTLKGDDGKDFDDPFPDQPTGLRRGSRPTEDVPAGDEEPPARQRPARQQQGSTQQCPNGYVFGADCDQKGLCFKCPDAIYNKCRNCKG